MADTFTTLVIGPGLWGAGDSESEALSNVPASADYLRDRGYVRIDFDSPVTDIEVSPFGARWQWATEDGPRTFTETEVA